jgi:putative transposase
MYLVERHIITDNRFEEICYKSGLLYNFVTYHCRQAIFGNQEYFSEFECSKLCAEFNLEEYRAFPAQTSQQIIKQVFKNFKSWQRAKKEFEKNPGKFNGRPKLPNFKSGKKQNIVIFTGQQVKIKDNYIHFTSNFITPIKTNVSNIKQVRIIPQSTCHIIEVIYEKEEINYDLNKENFLSIDLGLNNYVSTISNVEKSFIINGKIIKSFNQWFNKNNAKLNSYVGNKGISKRLSRLNNYHNCWIEDKNHKISRFIINHCIKYNIGTIIIGKNDGWKDGINLGHKTNQNFVQIPHTKLIQKIQYKAKLVGIDVILTEESYTSKIDNLALEPLKKQENYLGKRKKRGLFQSSTGRLINADIGITRKVISDSVVSQIINSGLVCNPYKIDIL